MHVPEPSSHKPRPEQSRLASFPYPSRGWAFLLITSRSPVPSITQTTNVFYCIPRFRIYATNFSGKMTCFSGQQVPYWLQSLGHTDLWQDTPSYPATMYTGTLAAIAQTAEKPKLKYGTAKQATYFHLKGHCGHRHHRKLSFRPYIYGLLQ